MSLAAITPCGSVNTIPNMHTDAQGMQPHSPPRAMATTGIALTVAEYARAAQLAIDAGFDGVEVHAANGYLIEPFLNAGPISSPLRARSLPIPIRWSAAGRCGVKRHGHADVLYPGPKGCSDDPACVA